MKPLTANVHLYTAMLDRRHVDVYIADELGGSGRIERITENSVKVGDAWYLRESCTFKYAG
ncbi:hypothetical protein [Paenibacillus sp. 7541]|uniref:hypothetical protein n=1 Tax=Paenibacillus sp. 7541 TaxID=2026236 RepID=UPI000BA718FE|nr:hypothetical protein [Paenibacillus sp. 7541]PAK55400.1 hypothetical protein CHH75_03930 [Paenibacillus sp. 7541]